MKLRLDALRKQPELADQPLQPIAGICVFQRLPMSNRQYIDLVDFQATGAPSGVWRTLIARAEAAGQRWMKGIRFARRLTATP